MHNYKKALEMKVVHLLSLLFLCIVAETSNVEIHLHATWDDTSRVAETVEFLAYNEPKVRIQQDVSDKKAMWSFLDALSSSPLPLGSHEEQWKALSDLVHPFLDGQDSLFHAAIGSRRYTAHVAAHYAVAQQIDDAASRCDASATAFAIVEGNNPFCSIEALEAWLAEDHSLVSMDDITLGHVFPFVGKHNVPTVYLYAHVGTKDAAMFHTVLGKAAEQALIRYVLRHAPRSTMLLDTHAMPSLSGFSAELAIKSKEYKLFDEQSGRSGTVENENAEEESGFVAGEVVHGVLFYRLQQRFPKYSSSLLTLRDSFLQEEETGPLKVWALSQVGIQSACQVLHAKDPMEMLQDITNNIPGSAPTLVRQMVNQSIEQGIAHNVPFLQQSGWNEGQNALLINGRKMDVDTVGALHVMDAAMEEYHMIQPLMAAGIPFDTSRQMMQDGFAHARATQWKFTSDHVLYINDLEHDSRYDGWPSSLNAFQQRRPYGARWVQVRKNVLTMVFVVDPSHPEGRQYLNTALQLVQEEAPVRVGFLFTNANRKDEPNPAIVSTLCAVGHAKAPRSVMEKIARLSSRKKVENTLPICNDATVMASARSMTRMHLPMFSVLVNGKLHLLPSSTTKETLISLVQKEQWSIQWMVRRGELNDRMTDLLQVVLTKDGYPVFQRYHPNVQPSTPTYDAISWLDIAEPSSTSVWSQVWNSLAFAVNKDGGMRKMTHLVVGNTDAEDTRHALTAMLERLSQRGGQHVRVGHLSCGGDATWWKTAVEQQATWHGGWSGDACSPLALEEVCGQLTMDGSPQLLTHGRITPVDASWHWRDVLVVEQVESYHWGDRMGLYLGQVDESQSDDLHAGRRESDYFAAIASWMTVQHMHATAQMHSVQGNRQRRPMSSIPDTLHKTALISLGQPLSSALHVQALINPLSVKAHRVVAAVQLLAHTMGHVASIQVVLNPVSKVSDLTTKSFYRHVWHTAPDFVDGHLTGPGPVVFDHLPIGHVLTLSLRQPTGWLVRAQVADDDMDNIRLIPGQRVCATYALQHILVEGSASSLSGSSPQGLTVVLRDERGHGLDDTLVMENFGYFQLQAHPGMFTVALEEGTSSIEYEIVNGMGQVVVEDLLGSVMELSVLRRPGRYGTPSFSPLVNPKHLGETVHVFSLASGHLYERLLKIMMLSAVRQCSSPIKFWLLENYLSPDFLHVLEPLSKKIGFEYELVTFHWPSFVREQTEKQRLIWGYKILFLDVMFPLNVSRVIYVDADQVIRGDLTELWRRSLNGAPIAMVPMGESRKETEGYRFWKQGFWKDHLRGKPYHISALFVLDLALFRARHYGDRYRGSYQSLSGDPNSLSNLDQDLPNYLQHSIPIHTLPPEWLWCETWCADEELKKAKTIDLCNNPLTKVPKLEAAKRTLPEWIGLDEEAREMTQKAKK